MTPAIPPKNTQTKMASAMSFPIAEIPRIKIQLNSPKNQTQIVALLGETTNRTSKYES